MLDNPKYIVKPHIAALEDLLISCTVNKGKRIIVSMPPRHGKSELTSKYFPAWLLMKIPNFKIILVSYESDFAESWGRRIRELIVAYGDICKVKLKDDTRAANRFALTNGSELVTAGAGGAIVGKGANIVIIDDPIKNHEQAFSKTHREKTWEWFNTTCYTRLEPDGSIIVIQTRWHTDDLSGRLLANNDGTWQNINFPALDENGKALFPERFTAARLLEIKKQIGNSAFASLYQQQPIAQEARIYREKWWRYYNEIPEFEYIVQSWDTAFKTQEFNDYSACVTMGVNSNGYYVVDIYRDKIEFPELTKRVTSQYFKHNPDVILIEDKASGQSIIQQLKTNSTLPIKGVSVSGSKELRAHIATPLIEAGKVFLPENAEWLDDFLTECSNFPLASHDDMVDAFNQGLNELKRCNKTTTVSTQNLFKQTSYFQL